MSLLSRLTPVLLLTALALSAGPLFAETTELPLIQRQRALITQQLQSALQDHAVHVSRTPASAAVLVATGFLQAVPAQADGTPVPVLLDGASDEGVATPALRIAIEDGQAIVRYAPWAAVGLEELVVHAWPAVQRKQALQEMSEHAKLAQVNYIVQRDVMEAIQDSAERSDTPLHLRVIPVQQDGNGSVIYEVSGEEMPAQREALSFQRLLVLTYAAAHEQLPESLDHALAFAALTPPAPETIRTATGEPLSLEPALEVELDLDPARSELHLKATMLRPLAGAAGPVIYREHSSLQFPSEQDPSRARWIVLSSEVQVGSEACCASGCGSKAKAAD